jgi:hypothetical protein
LDCFSDFADELVIFEFDELGIDKGIFDIPVSGQSHNMENIFSLMVFHVAFQCLNVLKVIWLMRWFWSLFAVLLGYPTNELLHPRS